MAYTFSGGIHLKENKNTKSSPAREFLEPPHVAIAMKQHTGLPCLPLVAAGERVCVGQPVGDNREGLCCPVHASVSGTVKALETMFSLNGERVVHAVIENDFKNELWTELRGETRPLETLAPAEIIARIRDAGIVGMGGGAYPAYAKLKSALGKARNLIINCAECEPYLTAGHRLLLERPEDVIKGIKILIHTLGLRKAVIAIEENKPDAVRALDAAISDKALIEIKIMKTKYPQGDERQIIRALFDREIPAGKTPAETGFAVFNPETALNIYQALATGLPSVYKRLTVDGNAVKKPGNLIVPVGTPFSEIARLCGGLKKRFRRLIVGGPMMGQAAWSLNGCVVKGTGGLLFLGGETEPNGACIRCGRCISACPARLMPSLLAAHAEKGGFEECKRLGLSRCVECGCCSYVCPGRVPLVQHIRNAKAADGGGQ